MSIRSHHYHIINIPINRPSREMLARQVHWIVRIEDFLMLTQGKTDLSSSSFSNSNCLPFFRQNVTTMSNEVPYARLLDSPSRVSKGKELIDSKISPTPSMKHESGSFTPKALRIPAPKTSSSDSKLTVDYFQGSEHSVLDLEFHSNRIET